ncbi:tripartite tricarboxylate transporter substrate binding protein [Orrella sp. JC864]|uniref:tripartite tricarboxylate transporter substrate binding protein n=1 Tax=Orrella sp. JC864 TaxID=3120298 RepID=UPI00300937A5
MKQSRTKGVAGLAAGLLAAVLGMPVDAASTMQEEADFPSRPITFVVPRSPGGGSDTITRLMAPGLEKRLGQSILVENKPDTAAVIGAIDVAKSRADGYRLYVSDNSFYQNPAVLPKLPYDTIKDFSGVTMLAQGPVVLLVHPSVPASNVQELIALAKEKPGGLTYSSGGIGSSTHLVGVLLNLEAGTNIVHVPYKSSSEALNALAGGHVDIQFGGLSSAAQLIASGRVKALAVTGEQRDPALPDVPTLRESGLKESDVMSVWGIHAPAGTPLAHRQKLRDAIVDALKEPQIAKRLTDMGYTMLGNTPQEHQQQTEEMVRLWLDLSKQVKLSD